MGPTSVGELPAELSCVCVCVCVGGGGACFTLKPRVILVAELDLTVLPASVCRGVSVRPVCYPQVQPMSRGSIPPSSRAEVRGQDASSLVFPAESCRVLSAPDSICSKARLLCLRLPFLFGALEPQACLICQLFPAGCRRKPEYQEEGFEKGLPRWRSGEELPASAGGTGDTGSIPGSGRSPGGGSGNLLHSYCLGDPIDREPCWATVRGVTESDMIEYTQTSFEKQK